VGDRGSISIRGQSSPVLFRHWGGSPESMLDLAERAYEFIAGHTEVDPWGRGDDGCILALLTKLAVDEDGYSAYLGATPNDGDNSDNGHYEIDPYTFEVFHNGVKISRA
jgi:hypothetical protein